jgi:hypothetical protein
MRYQVTTELTPRDALERAMMHFGSHGLGLTVTAQTPLGLVFQGGGGHVAITVQPGDETTLELETREWDYAVRQFMTQCRRRRHWWQRVLRRKRRTPSPPSGFSILNNGNNADHFR